MIPIRNLVKKIERFFIYRILHVDDTPHRLALGIALGVFIAWTPTIGLQMILVLMLAPLFHANSRVGLPFVWISNPLTFLLIYGPNYWLGHRLLCLLRHRPPMGYQQIRQLLAQQYTTLSHIHQPDFWKNLTATLDKTLSISADLWLGSLIIGLTMAIIAYTASFQFITWYRLTNPLHKLHLRRQARRQHRKQKKRR